MLQKKDTRTRSHLALFERGNWLELAGCFANRFMVPTYPFRKINNPERRKKKFCANSKLREISCEKFNSIFHSFYLEAQRDSLGFMSCEISVGLCEWI